MQARIKRMMQSDEDVGKVSKASPVLIAKALDVFLESMVAGAAQLADGRGARMLTASHIKAHVEGEELLDFLREAVAAVPSLPPAGSEPAKQKRQRAKTGSSEGGPAKVRSGAGRGGRGARSSRGQKGASQEADVDAQPVDAQQQHAPPGIQPPAGAHQAESAEPSSEAPLPPVSMPSFFAAAGVFGAEEEDYDA